MADKRMYTKKITDSDSFIELSSAAQALYFHLNQGADDDGFNNQIQNAMFKSHASIDDLKVLMAKNFIIKFENGVIVIKHWRMHNTLRKDRYVPTSFQEELKQLGLLENGVYEIVENTPQIESGNQMATKWQPLGNPDKIRIDKNRLDKISKDKISLEENRLEKKRIVKERKLKEGEIPEDVKQHIFNLLNISEEENGGSLYTTYWLVELYNNNPEIEIEELNELILSISTLPESDSWYEGLINLKSIVTNQIAEIKK